MNEVHYHALENSTKFILKIGIEKVNSDNDIFLQINIRKSN